MALFPFLISLNLLHNQQIALSVPMGYILSDQAKPWQEAEDYCMSTYGTHLASIQGDTEYNAMHTVASTGGWGVWIGLNDQTSEGVWEWSDSTKCVNNDCTTDKYWDSDQPDGVDSHDCAVIYHNFGYNDQLCNTYLFFICNDRLRTLTTTTTDIPTTNIPTTLMPTTNMPTTMIPTTSMSSTINPTTSEPTTIIPSSTPTTNEPTTMNPTSSNPTTNEPTTSVPTTSNPTSSKPTTNEPTTMNQTTSNPTTSGSTTSNPTTSKPTTSSPTSFTLTTSSPTKSPTRHENTAAFNDADDSLIEGDLVLILVIIAAILSILVVIYLLILCVYLKRRKKRQQNKVNGIELERVKSESQYETIIGTSPGSISSMGKNRTNKSLSININTTETPNTTVTMTGSDDAYSNDNALKMWLNNIQMIEYYDLFNQQGFCDHMDSLKKLTNDELKEMGITKMAHRINILSQIESNTQYVSDGEGVMNNNDDDDDRMYQKGHETMTSGGDNVTDFGGNDMENVNNENIEDEEEEDDRMYQKGGAATNGQ